MWRATALAVVLGLLPAACARASVAYERQADGAIVVADARGGHPRVVAHGQTPELAPDGRHVAYVVHRFGRGDAARVVGAHGGRPWTLLPDTIGSPAVTWSPDGRYAVAGFEQACLVDVRLRRRRCLRLGLEGYGGAVFSPSGRTLLVDDEILPDDSELVRVSMRRGYLGRLPGTGYLPVWGRRWLAWLSTDATHYAGPTFYGLGVTRDLRLRGKRTLLTTGADDALAPLAWSADGRRLLVAESVQGGVRALLLSPATGAVVTLPTPFSGVAALSRDGRRVLGTIGDDVVSVRDDGTVTVLATGATSPSWDE